MAQQVVSHLLLVMAPRFQPLLEDKDVGTCRASHQHNIASVPMELEEGTAVVTAASALATLSEDCLAHHTAAAQRPIVEVVSVLGFHNNPAGHNMRRQNLRAAADCGAAQGMCAATVDVVSET